MSVPFLHERYIRYSCLKCGHDAHCRGACSTEGCTCAKCECAECQEVEKNIERGNN